MVSYFSILSAKINYDTMLFSIDEFQIGPSTNLLYWKHFPVILWKFSGWIYMALFHGFYNLNLHVNKCSLVDARSVLFCALRLVSIGS